jgi:haloacetate dehalogenase
MLFPGFERACVQTREVAISLVRGGEGPPLLLLHGYPQTHVTWHKVAPLLAARFTVICPDLRGYGDSEKPASAPDHSTYAKRVMAADQAELMRALGFERFAVAGHDRGARVAHRLALDFPACVTHLALLDIVPTRTAFARVDQALATADYHWFFLIQPGGLPERLIGGAPAFFLRWTLDHWCGTFDALSAEAVAEYARCFDSATIAATCEDYRAAATIDLARDDADFGRRRVGCPLLLLWSNRGTGTVYDVAAVWREYATDVRGYGLDCGHFLPEERPEEVAERLLAFIGE